MKGRRVLERLYRGSGAVASGLGRGSAEWVKAGSGPMDCLIRLAFLTGALVVLSGIVMTTPAVMWGLVLWWIGAALKRGGPAKADGETAVPPPQESSEPAGEEVDSDRLVQVLREVASPNAHLAVVAQKLGTGTARVREALSRAGIPVSDVRMKDRGVSTGVKAADIPSPSPSPEGPAGVVGPGHNDNNNTGGEIRTFPDGSRALFVDDPENPAKTSLHWLKSEEVES
ncbi:hypothetical protein OG311_13485 [Streptomyces sp. NBC_01343]|uniref:hypothetical protein n=1 Tax=Streptomyces sp. NBC_01343 TaxID=2903832 RepID=UPI002E135062|nr:hypothetical protein OG311_13485 [Streptomyces sp. NBC_01343]